MKIKHFMIIFAALLVGGLLLVSTTTNITTAANEQEIIEQEIITEESVDIVSYVPVTYDANQKLLIYHNIKKCTIPNDDNIIAIYDDSDSATAIGAYPCDCW